MAKKDAAAKTIEPATDQLATAEKATTADRPKKERAPRAPRLDRFAFADQLAKQGGKCFVFGTKLGPGAVEFGGVIVSKEARKMIGSETLAEFRTTLLDDRREAQALVKLTDKLEVDSVIVFAGEQPDKPAADAEKGGAE